MNLHTEADLAEFFGKSERRITEWRRQFGWPHVRIGRQIRFTDAHLEQIIAAHSQAASKREEQVVKIDGQTKRSASRKRTA